MRGAADPSDGDVAADGEVEIVRQRERREATRQRRGDDLAPARSRADHGVVRVDLDRLERRGVDDDAVLDLRLTVGRMALPSHRDLEAIVAGVVDHLDHVAHRAGTEHCSGRAVDEVTEVVGRAGARARVGEEDSVEPRDPLETGASLRLREPGSTNGVEADDGNGRRTLQEPTTRNGGCLRHETWQSRFMRTSSRTTQIEFRAAGISIPTVSDDVSTELRATSRLRRYRRILVNLDYNAGRQDRCQAWLIFLQDTGIPGGTSWPERARLDGWRQGSSLAEPAYFSRDRDAGDSTIDCRAPMCGGGGKRSCARRARSRARRVRYRSRDGRLVHRERDRDLRPPLLSPRRRTRVGTTKDDPSRDRLATRRSTRSGSSADRRSRRPRHRGDELVDDRADPARRRARHLRRSTRDRERPWRAARGSRRRPRVAHAAWRRRTRHRGAPDSAARPTRCSSST